MSLVFYTTQSLAAANSTFMIAAQPVIDESHPGFLMGKYVVRPVIDMSYSIYEMIRQNLVWFDQASSRALNFIPFAQADLMTCSSQDICEKEPFSDIPLFHKLSHKELVSRLENLGRIGRGRDGRVFKVRDRQDGNLYALRIERASTSDRTRREREEFFNVLLSLKKTNPHMVRLISIFWLEVKHPPLWMDPEFSTWDNVAEGDFVCARFELEKLATKIYYEATLMELGEGSGLDPLFEEIEKKTAIYVQMIFNHFLLLQAGIKEDDIAYRNFIWLFTENYVFNGKRLQDYSYWHYTINGYHLYLPKPEFIVKRIDFGTCSLFEKDDPTYREPNWIAILAKALQISEEDLLQRYAKPDLPDTEILDWH